MSGEEWAFFEPFARIRQQGLDFTRQERRRPKGRPDRAAAEDSQRTCAIPVRLKARRLEHIPFRSNRSERDMLKLLNLERCFSA